MTMLVVSSRRGMRRVQLENAVTLFHLTWEEIGDIDPSILLEQLNSDRLILDCETEAHVAALTRLLRDPATCGYDAIGDWLYFRVAGLADHAVARQLYDNPRVNIYTIPSELQHVVLNIIDVCADDPPHLEEFVANALYCLRKPSTPRCDWTFKPRQASGPVVVFNSLHDDITVLTETFETVSIRPNRATHICPAEDLYRVGASIFPLERCDEDVYRPASRPTVDDHRPEPTATAKTIESSPMKLCWYVRNTINHWITLAGVHRDYLVPTDASVLLEADPYTAVVCYYYDGRQFAMPTFNEQPLHFTVTVCTAFA